MGRDNEATTNIQRLTAEQEAVYVDWTKVPDLEPRVPAFLRHLSSHWPDKEVLIYDGRAITYGQLETQSALLARQLLAAGVAKGTRVGMILPNTPEFLVSFFALTRIGAVAVPISTFSTATEIRRIMSHSDVALLIATDRFLNIDYVARYEEALPQLTQQVAPYRMLEAPFLRDVWMWADETPPWARRLELSGSASQSTDISPELLAAIESAVHAADPACIIYTSGSTSEPKGVIHTQGSMLRQARKIAATYPFEPDERVYTPMPFFWVGGLQLNLLQLMQIGATVIGSSDTSVAALLAVIEKDRPTNMVAWAHSIKGIAAHPTVAERDLSSLRAGSLYDALVGPERQGLAYGEALGMSETGGPHTISLFTQIPGFEMSYGIPMPAMEHRIVDPDTGADLEAPAVGVLLVRGNALMQGLVKKERHETFDADGWYRTGDLCSFVDGYLFFHGRADDLIKASGSNVSPGEVQAVLRNFPAVAQAHVTGLKDPQRGAVVGAVVVPDVGHTLDVDKLLEFAKQHLSSYKVPRLVLVVDPGDVPVMTSGKVDRLALIARLEALQAAERRT